MIQICQYVRLGAPQELFPVASGPSEGSLNEKRGGGGGGGGDSYGGWTARERHSLQLVGTENRRQKQRNAVLI